MIVISSNNHYSQKNNTNPSFQGKLAKISTEKLLELINSGKTVRQIKSELGISLDTYYKLLKERGIEYSKKKLSAKLSSITKEQLELCHSAKMTVSEICQKLGINESNYYRLLSYYDLKTPNKVQRELIQGIAKEQLQNCIDKYPSVEERCKFLGITDNVYYNLIKKFNVNTPYKDRINEVSHITAQDILALRQDGKNFNQIIKELNISQSIYSRLINQQGVITESKNSQQKIAKITKEILVNLLDAGKKVNEICMELGIKTRTYSRLLDKFGIETPTKIAKNRIKSITREQLQKLVDQNLSPAEICAELDINKTAFYKLLKVLDIKYEYLHHANEKIIPKRIMEEAIKSGKSTKEIADELGITVSTFHDKAKMEKVETVLRGNIDRINSISKIEFQKAIDSGLTVNEICEKFNITIANYSAIIRKYNISTPQREHMDKISNITKSQIERLLEQGYTKKEISAQLGIGNKIINKILMKAD